MQAEPEKFSEEVQALLHDPRNELLFSAASSWEIAIKYALGRLSLPAPPAEYIPPRIVASGVTPLPIHHAHTHEAARLPPHHRDPFDRLLVAQARLEEAAILTVDPLLAAYEVEIVKAR
jgi:PIN domain nuclease of toxin-antitoxin system